MARPLPEGESASTSIDGAIPVQTPLRVTFRHMEPSAVVEARIREHVERLERFFDRITGCHVIVEAPPAHRRKGAPFDIKVDLIVPGREIAVRSERAEHAAHTDVYVALRDVFDSAKRLLQDHAREIRGEVKHHELPTLGTVAELFDDYGRIAADDGHLVYFHARSVHGAKFADLAPGTVVEFAEEAGDLGVQAAAVRLWRNEPKTADHR